jgi:hypothetical protein
MVKTCRRFVLMTDIGCQQQPPCTDLEQLSRLLVVELVRSSDHWRWLHRGYQVSRFYAGDHSEAAKDPNGNLVDWFEASTMVQMSWKTAPHRRFQFLSGGRC